MPDPERSPLGGPATCAPHPSGTVPLVAVVQHTAVCPPGRLGTWLTEAGCRLQVFRCFAGDGLPASLDGYAGLVVLGGEMGAHDDALHPWLTGTKDLLARAVAEELPTLGICLGLQLLAVACGGEVAPSTTGPQLGLRAVEATPAGRADALLADVTGPGMRAVHWNNDLVTVLPPGAEVLATTAGTVQALRVGNAAWGVQFHPEVDPPTLRLWAAADVDAGLLDAATAEQRLAEVAAADRPLTATGTAIAQAYIGLLGERAEPAST